MSEHAITFPKAIYRQHELPQHIVDYLLSKKQALIDDYVRGYDSFDQAVRGFLIYDGDEEHKKETSKFLSFVNHREELENSVDNVNRWIQVGFRYHSKNELENVVQDFLVDRDSDHAREFPTATEIVYELLDHCPLACYSVIHPRTVLKRHTGPENREGNFLRIHMPLIIPEGNVFLECNGDEVQFADGIFGFNNQLLHSSHNYSDHNRLVFIIDLSFEFLGLPHPGPFKPEYHTHALPYTKLDVMIDTSYGDDYYNRVAQTYKEKQ